MLSDNVWIIIRRNRIVLFTLLIVSVLISWIFVGRDSEIKTICVVERYEQFNYPYENNEYIGKYLNFRNHAMYNHLLLRNGITEAELGVYKNNVSLSNNQYITFKIKGKDIDEINKLYEIEKSIFIKFVKNNSSKNYKESVEYLNRKLCVIDEINENSVLEYKTTSELKTKIYSQLIELQVKDMYDVELITLGENITQQKVGCRSNVKKLISVGILSIILYISISLVFIIMIYRKNFKEIN